MNYCTPSLHRFVKSGMDMGKRLLVFKEGVEEWLFGSVLGVIRFFTPFSPVLIFLTVLSSFSLPDLSVFFKNLSFYHLKIDQLSLNAISLQNL